MTIIKVNATDSTNLHLKRMMLGTALEDFTVLVTDSQLSGKGQAGTVWNSEPGKNLTFSVLKQFEKLSADQGFSVSMALSLALVQFFRELNIPQLAIKWPNDIMSGNKKICGILIENTLKGLMLKHAILGIGINVNQDNFFGLPNAASLKQITRKTYQLEPLLNRLLTLLEAVLDIDQENIENLKSDYESLLYLKDQKALYKIHDEWVEGFIRGTSPEGKLRVETAESKQIQCGLKEIKYP
ncbi:biotin--[acetyl-CoA-carboxylase] ligase [Muriicola soli]|uniref:Biotin--[acetyl-CoA-carboxylase] ligase n=1 Tax=Muriicola soli TaxID=2507538 RepID=A0A411E735_9FLAO|nr:biotin--[acetyl-CoA-carboxylase] ligase [Muriicola soli]QBA63516.1 biotin--[acetyl-CoA-carboxylase] ligase [Muriicola soli]